MLQICIFQSFPLQYYWDKLVCLTLEQGTTPSWCCILNQHLLDPCTIWALLHVYTGIMNCDLSITCMCWRVMSRIAYRLESLLTAVWSIHFNNCTSRLQAALRYQEQLEILCWSTTARQEATTSCNKASRSAAESVPDPLPLLRAVTSTYLWWWWAAKQFQHSNDYLWTPSWRRPQLLGTCCHFIVVWSSTWADCPIICREVGFQFKVKSKEVENGQQAQQWSCFQQHSDVFRIAVWMT